MLQTVMTIATLFLPAWKEKRKDKEDDTPKEEEEKKEERKKGLDTSTLPCFTCSRTPCLLFSLFLGPSLLCK